MRPIRSNLGTVIIYRKLNKLENAILHCVFIDGLLNVKLLVAGVLFSLLNYHLSCKLFVYLIRQLTSLSVSELIN